MYIKKILWAIAIIGLFVFAGFAYYFYTAMFTPNTNFENNEQVIKIPSNSSYIDVRQQLKPLLKDIEKFDALAKQKQYSSNIKPGLYVLKKDMSNNDIINILRSRNTPITLTFNNQQSLHHLAGRISHQIEVDSISLLEAMLDQSFLKAHNFSKETALAMYLPNSYQFFWNTSAAEFRERMLKEYKRFWTKQRQLKAEANNLSPEEVMVLAAIVHEESKQKSEQPTIAGVYLNRLRIGMPLQADPTLKYAAYQLPQYKNTIIRRVLNKHKSIDSPYNTYLYKGLPPGLITMPDLSAVKAVLNPKKHQFLYFSADPERIGFHKFAKTLSQHNRNARRYQNYLSSQGILR